LVVPAAAGDAPQVSHNREGAMSFQLELANVGKGAFENAIKYLKGSSTAREIIGFFEDHEGAMLVMATLSKQCTGHGVQFGSSQYLPPPMISESEQGKFPLGILHWWVLDWTMVKKDQFQTPALALIHEMGHAWQYFKVPKFADEFAKRPSKKMLGKIEADNLVRCETPVAKELSKWAPREAVRAHYGDNIRLSEADCQKLGIPEYNKPFSVAARAPKQQETYRPPW
jgi:hypothetical protein